MGFRMFPLKRPKKSEVRASLRVVFLVCEQIEKPNPGSQVPLTLKKWWFLLDDNDKSTIYNMGSCLATETGSDDVVEFIQWSQQRPFMF